MHHFEEWWRIPVQIVLLLFGVVNAGVPFTSVGTVTFIVLTSLIVGKPLGIVVATVIAERCGFERPAGLERGDLVTLGTAAGIGFTVALFFATAAFPDGVLLREAKMGALLSVVSFPLAVLAGRFRRPASPSRRSA
jgi:NhaA family Na+:H+ antiporter